MNGPMNPQAPVQASNVGINNTGSSMNPSPRDRVQSIMSVSTDGYASVLQTRVVQTLEILRAELSVQNQRFRNTPTIHFM